MLCAGEALPVAHLVDTITSGVVYITEFCSAIFSCLYLAVFLGWEGVGLAREGWKELVRVFFHGWDDRPTLLE